MLLRRLLDATLLVLGLHESILRRCKLRLPTKFSRNKNNHRIVVMCNVATLEPNNASSRRELTPYDDQTINFLSTGKLVQTVRVMKLYRTGLLFQAASPAGSWSLQVFCYFFDFENLHFKSQLKFFYLVSLIIEIQHDLVTSLSDMCH